MPITPRDLLAVAAYMDTTNQLSTRQVQDYLRNAAEQILILQKDRDRFAEALNSLAPSKEQPGFYAYEPERCVAYVENQRMAAQEVMKNQQVDLEQRAARHSKLLIAFGHLKQEMKDNGCWDIHASRMGGISELLAQRGAS